MAEFTEVACLSIFMSFIAEREHEIRFASRSCHTFNTSEIADGCHDLAQADIIKSPIFSEKAKYFHKTIDQEFLTLEFCRCSLNRCNGQRSNNEYAVNGKLKYMFS